MALIAITGRFASGKSTVLKLLKAKGACVFDADRRLHAYYRDKESLIYKRIKKAHPECFDRTGKLLRSKLGACIFYNDIYRSRLERITHPVIIRDLRTWAASSCKKKGIFIAEIPLLFEEKLDTIFDKVILVIASEHILLKRIKLKYNIPKQDAIRRLALFLPNSKKKNRCDFVIYNNTTICNLKRKVDALWQKLKRG